MTKTRLQFKGAKSFFEKQKNTAGHGGTSFQSQHLGDRVREISMDLYGNLTSPSFFHFWNPGAQVGQDLPASFAKSHAILLFL